MWSNLGIRQKVFALFTIIALVPLVIINIIWLRSSHAQLKQAATTRQSILLSSSAQRLNESVEAKINSIITHSQESSIINGNLDQAKLNLLQFANLDSDMARIALVDSNGNEQVVITNHELSQALKNVKSAESFKVVTQLSNDAWIGQVAYVNGQPHMEIAVPILSFSRLGDQNLTNAQALARRYGSDVKGALIADISLNNLWKSVLSAESGTGGYTYIVDSQGKLIAHPDARYVTNHPDLSRTTQVAQFLQQPAKVGAPAIMLSEKQVNVLSAHYPIKRTGWAVIAQEPVSNIFEPANHVVKLAVFIFIGAGVISMLLSLLFSRTLTRPIRSLVTGASQLGEGNLGMRLPVKSADEIGILATRFNAMAANLQQLILNLEAEGSKLNVVLDNVGDGIVAIDSQNNIVIANISAAVLAGTLPSNLQGKSFDSVFPLTRDNQSLRLDMESSSVYEVYKEVIFTPSNKPAHYLDIFMNKMKDDPSGIKVIVTLRDQTNERQLEMMKVDFVSMAAHELRTPITAIRGYLGLLSTDTSSVLSEAAKQFIERAELSTKQLVGLISNLLNVSKIERGSLNMSYSKVDWAKVVQDAVHDHEFSATEKHLHLSYVGPAEGVPLVADDVAIREVVNNLIANAIHYTDPDGHITVKLRSDKDQVITEFQDDGHGIPPDALPRLFTKFYRVNGGLASGSGGTGLGLYISKSIVELHKGTIGVKSQEGSGSTFTVSLPAYDEVQYEELLSKQDTGVKKHRGWVTKNTAR